MTQALIATYIKDKSLHAALMEQFSVLQGIALYEAASLPDAFSGDAQVVVTDSAAGIADPEAMPGKHPKALFVIGDAGKFGSMSGVEVFNKPLYLGHLLDRLQFHINVVPRLRPATLLFAGFKLETQSRQVTLPSGGEPVHLTEKETAILEHLASAAKPVPREDLLAAVWGYDGRIDTHTLETHIYQLRRKLDPNGGGAEVLSNDGHGYFLKQG